MVWVTGPKFDVVVLTAVCSDCSMNLNQVTRNEVLLHPLLPQCSLHTHPHPQIHRKNPHPAIVIDGRKGWAMRVYRKTTMIEGVAVVGVVAVVGIVDGFVGAVVEVFLSLPH